MEIVTLQDVSLKLRLNLSQASGVPQANITNLTPIFSPPLNFSPNSNAVPHISELTAQALLEEIWNKASASRKQVPGIPNFVLGAEKTTKV